MRLLKIIKYHWEKFKGNIEKYPLTSDQVKETISKVFKKSYIEATDRMYMTCDYKTAKRILPLIPVKYQRYKKEYHDCENFAKEYWAFTGKLFPRLPIGYCHVITGNNIRHAANFIIYVSKNGSPSLMFIEPQTGKVAFFDWKPYLMLI